MFFRVFCILFLIGAGSSLWADEQIVQVVVQSDQNGTGQGTKATDMQMVLARGVLQEAVELLPGTLSAARKEALLSVLSTRADEYVLSYSRGKAETSPGFTSTSWRIAVNEKGLKEALKSWGIYFTTGGPWPYALDLRTPSPQKDRRAVDRLETLTGVQSQGAGGPRLVLDRMTGQAEAWKGKLEAGDRSWSRSGSDLEEVWLGLWADYFGLQEVQARVLENLILEVKGWSTVTGVQGFDRILSKKSALVERAVLKKSDLLVPSVRGTWSIHTPDRRALKRFLDDYLSSRGLGYTIRAAGKE